MRDLALIVYDAFAKLAKDHNVPGGSDFLSVEVAQSTLTHILQLPGHSIFVAENQDGEVVGGAQVSQIDPIHAIDIAAISTKHQSRGVGRRLFTHIIEEWKLAQSPSLRLFQESFNVGAFALYVSLGFVPREPYCVFIGKTKSRFSLKTGIDIRRMTETDIPLCDDLFIASHGHSRRGDITQMVKDAEVTGDIPHVVIRNGNLTGYTTGFCPLGHTMAATEEDIRDLITYSDAITSRRDIRVWIPIRHISLIEWAIKEKLMLQKHHTFMVIGEYQKPKSFYLGSTLYKKEKQISR
eukprot:TRINITY_DN279_c2_g1_i1.p1 TRINITY_DN279_c2_g1~~TRINITY_DN279_c2_g1_i1.p1  ORF type:complete len:322 (-),score=46.05 TRINITY_DN279_c2_g1_i1:30-914(-)